MKVVFIKDKKSAGHKVGEVKDLPSLKADNYINQGFAKIYEEPKKNNLEIENKEENLQVIEIKEKKVKNKKK